MKKITISAHAKSYIEKRGFSEEEVREAIKESKWEKTELDRLHCFKDFSYGKLWNGKVYDTKQIRPIFVEEESEIVVITVYTYYF